MVCRRERYQRHSSERTLAVENASLPKCGAIRSTRPKYAHKNMFQNTIRSLRLLIDKTMVDTARDLLAKPAISAGVGLIYKLNPIRLEVNFGVPLAASKTDKMQRGFQMGIGLEFL